MTYFSADEDRLRVCSVACGIVKVTMEKVGEDGKEKAEFQLGPNGVWKVNPGWKFSVVNPFHMAAAVHVTGVLMGGE
jgi:hypothetical protein